ncbi:hypothetical protein M3592_26480 [Priestia aryabhattai]|uniref:hypothetical protein n=1 Tax=Priestia aryabhattai TaxID=412384 RepID=UPI00203B439D|nr:hypothetical protein [Priestia aryabhattai]MCM2978989.1 hypothetical protein [Priestia aryabhattai]
MKFKCFVKEAEFIMTKDELGYQEVLDDFDKAEYVCILTYNISAKSLKLLRYIDKLKHTTKVDIITNIPSRFEEYTSQFAKGRAKKMINIYLDKLNPKKYDSLFSSYFSFNNHAKIVMTNNIIYVGSSNFSDESNSSFECGILSKDVEFIEYIKNKVLPYIKDEAEQYYSHNSTNSIRINLKFIYYKLASVIEEVHMACYSIADHQGKEWSYFDLANNRYFLQEALDRLNIVFEEFKDILPSVLESLEKLGINIENLEDLVADLKIEDIQLLYSDDTSIYNLLTFDNQNYAMKYINENELLMAGEDIDAFRESASQVAFEKESSLEELAKEDVTDLLCILTEFKEKTEKFIDEITSSSTVNEKLDNTNS